MLRIRDDCIEVVSREDAGEDRSVGTSNTSNWDAGLRISQHIYLNFDNDSLTILERFIDRLKDEPQLRIHGPGNVG